MPAEAPLTVSLPNSLRATASTFAVDDVDDSYLREETDSNDKTKTIIQCYTIYSIYTDADLFFAVLDNLNHNLKIEMWF